MLIYIFFYFVSTVKADLFAEDGTGIASHWYRSELRESQISDYERLSKAMDRLGLIEKIAPSSHQWVEDLMLMKADGSYLDQTTSPGGRMDKDILRVTIGLISGDAFDESGPVKRVKGDDLGLYTEKMKVTFVEGGELIAGYFSNGEAYAIIRNTVVWRSERLLAYRRYGSYDRKYRNKIDRNELMQKIANDFGIKRKNLFSIQAPGHIDLFMKAMPNGRLLLHQSDLVAPTLRNILKGNLPKKERIRLEAMLDKYQNGVKKNESYYPMEAKAYQKQYNDIEEQLGARFDIIRLAGFFKEELRGPKINFFNGISATNKDMLPFFLTNDGKGLQSLEDYFLDFMNEIGYGDWYIDFVFESGKVDGLDCAVYLAP